MNLLGLLAVIQPADVPIGVGITFVLLLAVERGLAGWEKVRGR